MKRWLLACLLCATACVDRSLDPGATSSSGPGSTVDGGTPTPFDLSKPSVIADLAIPSMSTVGITCGADTCTDSESCCPGAGGAPWSCAQDQCAGGTGYRCDGPEDCAMGRVCAGSQSGPGFTVQRTRCRMTPGPGDVTICHVDADCAPDGICVDGGSSNPGAPLLRICILPI